MTHGLKSIYQQNVLNCQDLNSVTHHQKLFSSFYQHVSTVNKKPGDHFLFLASLYIVWVSTVIEPFLVVQDSSSLDYLPWQVQHPLLPIFYVHCITRWFFTFIFTSLIWKHLRVSYKQYLPTKWLTVWRIMCADVFLLDFCIFISITEQYLVLSLFHHRHYSENFREPKFLGSVCLSELII